jgi:hypothetical protein
MKEILPVLASNQGAFCRLVPIPYTPAPLQYPQQATFRRLVLTFRCLRYFCAMIPSLPVASMRYWNEIVPEVPLWMEFCHLTAIGRPFGLLFTKLIEIARVSSKTFTPNFSACRRRMLSKSARVCVCRYFRLRKVTLVNCLAYDIPGRIVGICPDKIGICISWTIEFCE